MGNNLIIKDLNLIVLIYPRDMELQAEEMQIGNNSRIKPIGRTSL